MIRNILMLLLIPGAFFSCKKQTGNIVLDGQGNGRQLELFYVDTLAVSASTIKEDSLPGSSLTYQLLGAMNDPIFGPSAAGIISQMSLIEPNNNFDNSITPDSAILFIPFISGLNFYGNLNDEQRINVFELKDKLSDRSYYQKEAFPVNTDTRSTYKGRLYFTRYDSVKYRTGKIEVPPGLRIKLSNEMAKRLMSLPKDAYASNSNFLNNFNGLSIQPDGGDLFGKLGGYGIFDMNTSAFGLGFRAKVMLYYKDTNTFVFGFTGKNTTITNTFTGPYPANIQTQINNPGQNYPSTYVQGLSGLKTWFKLPTLYNLASAGNVAINNAEITFYVDKSNVEDFLFAPPRLNLFQPFLPGSVRNNLLADAIDAGTGFIIEIGGKYNAKEGTYTFSITRQLQKWLNSYILKGKDIGYGLYLTVPTDNPVTGSRIVIDHSKTRLKIAYTKPN